MRHTPRRRFSQNFLVDPIAIERIVAAIGPRPDDALVEIGPGLGALTRPLAARVRRLEVIDIDRDIAARLEQEFAGKNVTVHAADVLAFDLSALGDNLRIVGNLPYHISTPILFHLASHAGIVRDIHVMLQREVVDRMVAAPGGPVYGRLSVMLQYRFVLEKLLEVPSGAFRPAPKVESAVVRLTPRDAGRQTARDEHLFARIVTAAFSQRRKTLHNALRGLLDDDGLRESGVAPGQRAQELPVAAFVRLADAALARQSG